MPNYGRFPIRSAEEAAELISHGASLGIGGFTDPGCPHAVPIALAKRARGLHERGEAFRVRILSGAEAGPAVDVDLVEADAVSFRMPFQLEKTCRDAINQGKIDFADIHLSHCSQQLFEGVFGKIDFAVIEASDISDDGRVSFTTAIGNGPTYLQLAEKVVIEINRHHPKRVREFSDIVILPLPPHREPIPIRQPLDRIGAPFAKVDPAKVVAIVETDEPSTRLPPRQPDAVSKKIAQHLVDFFLEELTAGRLPRAFLPLQSGVGNVGNALLAGLGEHPDLPAFTLFTEVFQDSCVDLMRSGRLTGASSTALTLSEANLQEIYDDFDYFGSRIVLRPQEISNNPIVIRQLGVIATNTALEVDIYGHANSSHVCGTQMMNGIGGAGGLRAKCIPFGVCLSLDCQGGENQRDRSLLQPRGPLGAFRACRGHGTRKWPIYARVGTGRTRASTDRPLCPPRLSRLSPSLCRGDACGPHPPRPDTLLRVASQSDRARSHAPRT